MSGKPDASKPLQNSRHELYCQARADGMTQMAAYVAAGYTSNPQTNAWHIEKKVTERIAFIMKTRAERTEKQDQRIAESIRKSHEEAIQKVALSKEWVLAELRDNAEKAKAAIPVLDSKGEPTGEYRADWSASNQALKLLGVELGMFVEKSERGKPGDFEKLTPQAVRQALAAVEDELAKRRAQKASEAKKAG